MTSPGVSPPPAREGPTTAEIAAAATAAAAAVTAAQNAAAAALLHEQGLAQALSVGQKVEEKLAWLRSTSDTISPAHLSALLNELFSMDKQLVASQLHEVTTQFQTATCSMRDDMLSRLARSATLYHEPAPGVRQSDKQPSESDAKRDMDRIMRIVASKEPPPKFFPGKDNAQKFVKAFDFWVFKQTGYMDASQAHDQGRQFAAIATGQIQNGGRPDWFRSLKEGQLTWDNFKEKFLLEYDVGVPIMEAHNQIKELRCSDNPEGVLHMSQHLKTLFLDAKMDDHHTQQWWYVGKLPKHLQGHAMLMIQHGCTTDVLMRDICARAGVYHSTGTKSAAMDLSAARMTAGEEEEVPNYNGHNTPPPERGVFASGEGNHYEVNALYGASGNERGGRGARPGPWVSRGAGMRDPASGERYPQRGTFPSNPPSRGSFPPRQPPASGSGQRIDEHQRQRRYDQNLCMACGKSGHWKMQCPNVGPGQTGQGQGKGNGYGPGRSR
jgi:hypothetical protein